MRAPFVLTCVVEGHGEVEALPVLLRRILLRIAPEVSPEIPSPIRVNRGTMLKSGQLERYVDFAGRRGEGRAAVLVLVDADDDCAASTGPALLARAQSARPASAVALVLAVKEFEAWFLAAARSLRGRRGLALDLEPPAQPEDVRDAKGWLQRRRTDGLAYGPTVDQPALAAVMDLDEARAGAPSFDKLWREVERLLEATA